MCTLFPLEMPDPETETVYRRRFDLPDRYAAATTPCLLSLVDLRRGGKPFEALHSSRRELRGPCVEMRLSSVAAPPSNFIASVDSSGSSSSIAESSISSPSCVSPDCISCKVSPLAFLMAASFAERRCRRAEWTAANADDVSRLARRHERLVFERMLFPIVERKICGKRKKMDQPVAAEASKYTQKMSQRHGNDSLVCLMSDGRRLCQFVYLLSKPL